MEEKELIRGSSKDYGKTPTILLIVGLFLMILATAFTLPDAIDMANARYGVLYWFWWDLVDLPVFGLMFFGGLVCVVIGLFMMYQSKCEIVVTNKRVYGKAKFSRQVDIPIDSITAVGTSAFNGISVASSSGRIVFVGIENRDAVRDVISDLLLERQEKQNTPTTIRQEIPQSNAEEIKKYKELMDSGIITKEEFDAKKKQLLDL